MSAREIVYSANDEVYHNEDPEQVAQDYMDYQDCDTCTVWSGETFEANEEELAMMSDTFGFEAAYGVHKTKVFKHYRINANGDTEELEK